MKRLLNEREKRLAMLIFGSNKTYLNKLTINVNAYWIKNCFCCENQKSDREYKYGLVINKNIYFNFDPNYDDIWICIYLYTNLPTMNNVYMRVIVV